MLVTLDGCMLHILQVLQYLQGLKAATKKHKYEKISEKKMATPIDILCRGFPLEFSTYFQYCRSLRFDDKPDYGYLRKIFRDLFVRQGTAFSHNSVLVSQGGINLLTDTIGLNNDSVSFVLGCASVASNYVFQISYASNIYQVQKKNFFCAR